MKQDIDIRLNNLANVVDALETRIEELERPTVISIEEGYTGERMNIGSPVNHNELKIQIKVVKMELNRKEMKEISEAECPNSLEKGMKVEDDCGVCAICTITEQFKRIKLEEAEIMYPLILPSENLKADLYIDIQKDGIVIDGTLFFNVIDEMIEFLEKLKANKNEKAREVLK